MFRIIYRPTVSATNLKVGNDKQKLLDTVTQILPYIGYPRSLNAINIINEVSKD